MITLIVYIIARVIMLLFGLYYDDIGYEIEIIFSFLAAITVSIPYYSHRILKELHELKENSGDRKENDHTEK